MNKLKNILEKVLKSEAKFCDPETGELNYIKVKDSADKIDQKLISLIVDNDELKNKFFCKIKDVYVFNTRDFKFFLDESKVDNSYTAYKNRIGLADGAGFLENRSEVVLDFPFKDCVLEGGQSSEEGIDTYFEYDQAITKTQQKQGLKAKTYNRKTAKRKEVFFNQVLAYDEIDRLFDHKALTNWKRFDKDGQQEVQEIKRDKNGTIKENLIIKGNNLLALHSLKKQFAGKIKLIYIDPPYNTGNDGFKYNDNFNHSTWLTFMKNRLEVARELLREDGVIFVQCDDNEQAYLKVLMDEVFGRGQTDCMVWRKSGVGRDGKMKNTTTFRKDHEYVVLGFKNQKILNKSLEKPNWENEQTNPDNDPRGSWLSGSISRTEESSNPNHKNYYTVKSPSGKEFTRQFEVPKYEFERLDGDGRISWGSNGDNTPRIKVFENEERETNTSSLILFNGTSTEGKKEIEDLFGNIDEFATPKPEAVMKKIIQISTQPNDIVLDYHLGSGTTCAVAHKMGRQYIGVEQMDYVETIAVERLGKVIGKEQKSNDLINEVKYTDYDQGGISKAVGWRGGGDFIYLKLAKWNQKAKEEILGRNSLDELIKFFDEMYQKYFLNYNLKIKEFKEKVIREEEFKKLSLGEQKRMFLTMLDLNQMYINTSEMRDERYGISKEDQDLTHKFYNSEK
jgi:adenine-specific DNA-methyltransferase